MKIYIERNNEKQKIQFKCVDFIIFCTSLSLWWMELIHTHLRVPAQEFSSTNKRQKTKDKKKKRKREKKQSANNWNWNLIKKSADENWNGAPQKLQRSNKSNKRSFIKHRKCMPAGFTHDSIIMPRIRTPSKHTLLECEATKKNMR